MSIKSRNSNEAPQLQKLLLEKIIPWVQLRGMANVFTAYPSWQAFKKSGSGLPEGFSVSRKPLQSEPVRGRSSRTYGNRGVEELRWPKDKLLSARVPKLCFILEGPVAFQIADYVLHCNPGHGILLPPGTPFPDGTLSVLDKTKMHNNACELLMILPRQGSINCWTSRQWFDEENKMRNKSVSCSAPQTQVTNLLHQLIDESFQRKNLWERVCSCILEMIISLLYRELRVLPTIAAGNVSYEAASPMMQNPIQRVEEYIKNNLQSTAHLSLTIDQMARYAYLSRTAFIQQFRATTGKTFNEYVNDCRFERACQLLQGSELSVYHISLQVGISARRLRDLIQQRSSLSPTALRQEYRKKNK